MSRTELGRLIVGVGAFMVVLGLVVWSGALSWFGRLPGDIRIERETVRIYIRTGRGPTRFTRTTSRAPSAPTSSMALTNPSGSSMVHTSRGA